MAYTLTGRKTGVVRFAENAVIDASSESASGQVTSNPLEGGSDINDHLVNGQWVVSISGVTVGGMDAFERLEKMREERDLLEYQGKIRRDNLVISSLSRDERTDNADGCGFKATLTQVRITTTDYVKAGERPLMSVQDAGKPKAMSGAQTNQTQAEGRRTENVTLLSDSAYLDYVDSFANKSVGAPAGAATPATSGAR